MFGPRFDRGLHAQEDLGRGTRRMSRALKAGALCVGYACNLVSKRAHVKRWREKIFQAIGEGLVQALAGRVMRVIYAASAVLT